METIKGTKDALLFVFNADYTRMDVFVARGQKNNQKPLYDDLAGGELDEIELLPGQLEQLEPKD